MVKLRKVEIKDDDKWKEISFSELKKGDIFRLFESDGTPVKDLYNRTEFLADTNAYMSDEVKQYTIEIDSEEVIKC